MTRITPRNAVRWSLVVVALLGAGCGDDDNDDDAGSAAATPRTFVGITEGSDEVVALTLLADGAVEAYVCDGEEVGEFFEGTLNGDTLSVTSRRGAALEATFDGDIVSGTFALGDEKGLPFEAALNNEAAIYLVDVSADGTMVGEAAGNATFDAAPTSTGVEGTAVYPSGEELALNGQVVIGQELPVDDLRAGLAEGELDITGDHHTFSFYQGGEASQLAPANVLSEFAGEYRFTLFDGLMVGGNTADVPREEQGLINCLLQP
jgi:hypothetical protein